jgi:hypothetical protein
MNTLLFLKLLLPSNKWAEESRIIKVAVIAFKLSDPSDRTTIVLVAVVRGEAMVLLPPLVVRLLR